MNLNSTNLLTDPKLCLAWLMCLLSCLLHKAQSLGWLVDWAHFINVLHLFICVCVCAHSCTLQYALVYTCVGQRTTCNYNFVLPPRDFLGLATDLVARASTLWTISMIPYSSLIRRKVLSRSVRQSLFLCGCKAKVLISWAVRKGPLSSPEWGPEVSRAAMICSFASWPDTAPCFQGLV